MSDSAIIASMIDIEAERYFAENLDYRISAEEAYEKCIEFCDTELSDAFKTIREVILQANREYGYSVAEILNDMVIPSLDAEVTK